MVRGSIGTGPFTTDFSAKLYLCIITVLMCIYDWQARKRRDYFWVFITGALIWSGAELFLQLYGTRVFAGRYLFGYSVPIWVAIPIQGIAEGAFVAVFGIFIGDRVMERDTRKLTWIIFAILMGLMILHALRDGVQIPNVGGDVPSRREMFGGFSIGFLGIMVLINLIWLVRTTPHDRKRGLYLLLVMLIFGACWTLGEWAAGTRWIEVGTGMTFSRAPPMIEFGALTFDVVVEIALAYLPFFAIPSMMGLINGKNRRV